MATKGNENVTPEKVKFLLSSFVLPPKQTDGIAKKSLPVEDSPTKEQDGSFSGKNENKSESHSPKNITQDQRNRDGFFERLYTYTTFTWFAKPADLSPLVCARYGWQNIDTDMLECVGCKAKLCGQLPPTTDSQNYQDCCKKLKEKLKSSHLNSCSWSSNPSPESFAVVPVYNAKEVLEEFYARFESLQSCVSQLPALSIAAFAEQGIDDEKITRSAKCVLEEDVEEISDNLKSAFLLAACGWKFRAEKTPVLFCVYCQRSVGLWNYRRSSIESENTNDNSDDQSDEPAFKKFKMSKKESFDPLSEHRYWCAWVADAKLDKKCEVNKTDINGSVKEEKPWISVLKILCPTEFHDDLMSTMSGQFKQNSPTAGLRHLRKMIRDWSSPYKLRKDNSF